MEQMGKIIKQNQSLTSPPNTSDGFQTSALLQQAMDFQELTQLMRSRGAQEWEILILRIAQDKRHDLAPEVLPLWRAKLSGYSDEEICESLTTWTDEFFPAVDQLMRWIERRRELKFEAQQQAEWPQWKAKQAQAEREGQLATQEQYDELREVFRKVAFGPPLIPMKPLGVKSGKSGEAVQVQQSVESGAQTVAPQVGPERESDQAQQPGQAS